MFFYDGYIIYQEVFERIYPNTMFPPNLAFEKLVPFKTANNVKYVSGLNIYYSNIQSTFKL
jgi:hypothetical protein